ncbi:hypothetical protein MSG28_012675 [Choristoneura fumiferana]|uniref:Uncharacterized protein n=1 Tax=Choristoneura fumiferana TaxID=7141 RepID=A0ACC0JHM2_CHOFU|nr:hypothetical protein MSG28_012675 [Choristoneura fumiferana]
MGLALTVLGKTMTGILTKSTETSETLRLLNDAAKLIADSHFAETETRRSLIVPMLDKDFIEPFKDRKRDGYLFGDKLGDFIKSSRGLKKTGQLMQATGSTSSLNSRAPPPFRQQLQRAQVPARRTVGGPRAAQAPSAAYRRRARAAPAPPARQAPVTSSRAERRLHSARCYSGPGAKRERERLIPLHCRLSLAVSLLSGAHSSGATSPSLP